MLPCAIAHGIRTRISSEFVASRESDAFLESPGGAVGVEPNRLKRSAYVVKIAAD
jgi:hypothetical protein